MEHPGANAVREMINEVIVLPYFTSSSSQDLNCLWQVVKMQSANGPTTLTEHISAFAHAVDWYLPCSFPRSRMKIYADLLLRRGEPFFPWLVMFHLAGKCVVVCNPSAAARPLNHCIHRSHWCDNVNT